MRFSAEARARVALALLLVAASGCLPSVRARAPQGSRGGPTTYYRGHAALALRRAARDIPCAYDQMSVENLGSREYRVDGCGASIVYTCVGEACARGLVHRSGQRAAAPGDPHAQWTDEDVRMLLARVHDDVVACLPSDRDSQRITVTLMRTGRVNRVGELPLPREVTRCIDARFAAEELGRRVPRPRLVMLEFRRGAAVSRQTIGALEDAPAPPIAAAPSPEAAARAAVDAQRGAILACVESGAVSMQIAWSSEGGLDALLGGEPEEGCVRAIVRRLSIPPPGAPGTLVHTVER